METGLKPMAVTNNNSTKQLHQSLSIQISLSGLSFCVLQHESLIIENLTEINFSKKLNHLELLEAVKSAFNTHPQLQSKNYDSITLIHDNDLSNLVPYSLFDENNLADYLKFNTKLLKFDFIATDNILLNDSVNVYVPFVNINNYIYDCYGEFTFKHTSTILIESLLEIEKNAESEKMYVNISKTHFEVVIIKNSKLILYNTFEYNTKEDFIYYILFVAEQLELNPEIIELVLLGNINETDDIYEILYKYIRNVSFGNFKTNYTFTLAPTSTYSNFVLLKSF